VSWLAAIMGAGRRFWNWLGGYLISPWAQGEAQHTRHLIIARLPHVLITPMMICGVMVPIRKPAARCCLITDSALIYFFLAHFFLWSRGCVRRNVRAKPCASDIYFDARGDRRLAWSAYNGGPIKRFADALLFDQQRDARCAGA